MRPGVYLFRADDGGIYNAIVQEERDSGRRIVRLLTNYVEQVEMRFPLDDKIFAYGSFVELVPLRRDGDFGLGLVAWSNRLSSVSQRRAEPIQPYYAALDHESGCCELRGHGDEQVVPNGHKHLRRERPEQYDNVVPGDHAAGDKSTATNGHSATHKVNGKLHARKLAHATVDSKRSTIYDEG